MTDKERLDIFEEKLVEMLQKQEIVEAQMAALVAHIADVEARLDKANARQESWPSLLGLTLTDADLTLNLWAYPDLLRQQAEARQN